jgi:hypothetical protein
MLSTLVASAPTLEKQLKDKKITCWGYNAEAGLVPLGDSLGVLHPFNGVHIYGSRLEGKLQHCGYDSNLTTQLQWEGGKYVISHISKALCTLDEVEKWSYNPQPGLAQRFPELYKTLKPTSM